MEFKEQWSGTKWKQSVMSKKFTIIGTRNNQGLFSNFFHTLQHLKEAELENRIPIVYWYGGAYSTKKNKYNGIKTDNIWEYYFEPVSEYSAKEIAPKAKMNRYGQLKFKGDSPWLCTHPDVKISFKFHNKSRSYEPSGCWDTQLHPPEICLNNPTEEGREYINGLINKYVKIKQVVLDKFDVFYQRHMRDNNCLGVHIRGCNDAWPAQGINPIKRYTKYATKYLKNNSHSKIFVATDHHKSLKAMVNVFGDRVCYRSVTRSKSGNPVQYGCKPKRKHNPAGPKAGEEALIDALLLSKCQFMLRGFSNVASCASFFNPHMKLKYICKYDSKLKKYLNIST